MEPVALFGIQFTLSLGAYALIAGWYVEPRLSALPRELALVPLLWLHAFRIVGGPILGAVGTESFRSAPGPGGWRYFGEFDSIEPVRHGTVDVVAGAGWEILRVRIDTGEHSLLLEARDDALVGERDGSSVVITFAPELDV